MIELLNCFISVLGKFKCYMVLLMLILDMFICLERNIGVCCVGDDRDEFFILLEFFFFGYVY